MKALIAAALVVSAVPVIAGSGQEGATSVREERKVCRALDINPGSRVQRRRACMTATQWRAHGDSQSKTDLDDLELRGNRPGPYGDGLTPTGKGTARGTLPR